MRKIEPKLPNELINKGYDPKKIFSSQALYIHKYSELVDYNAKIAYLNKDYLLFYRGQCQDYLSKSGSSSFYPSIYREEYISSGELKHLFNHLDKASNELIKIFEDNDIEEGRKELKRKQYIQWSLLQHYQICKTPLLDFTHSLRVACSFAQCNNDSDYGFVFIFGLPYMTNRISINSEHDIVNIRLISISPPAALRPYYQEAYLAGTTDITDDYDQKTELDFRNRLIIKIKIPKDGSFWGKEFNRIPDELLFPKNDRLLALLNPLKKSLKKEFMTGDLGDFLEEWLELENLLKDKVAYFKDFERRNYSVRRLIDLLYKRNIISKDIYTKLDELRLVRNILIHEPKKIEKEHLPEIIKKVRELKSKLKDKLYQNNF
ncbi:MAG: FRG domain-containing protein [Promethearchaeota archaeon]